MFIVFSKQEVKLKGGQTTVPSDSPGSCVVTSVTITPNGQNWINKMVSPFTIGHTGLWPPSWLSGHLEQLRVGEGKCPSVLSGVCQVLCVSQAPARAGVLLARFLM